MEFKNKAPDWNAPGVEPPVTLKERGFEAGYKPPASYFNWFWHGVSACLKELIEKLLSHANDKKNPHNVTAAQLGLGDVDNTPDAEKNVAFASEAAAARKVNSNMIVRFNGGSVEGTSLFTYNGSTSKSVNITPARIGAAESNLGNVGEDVFRNKAKASGVLGIPIVEATSTDGKAYTATVDGVTELYNGMMLTIIPNMTSTDAAITLDVNGLGAKYVRIALSFNNAAMTIPRLETYYTEGRPITIQYDANYTTGGAWKTIKQRTSAQDLYGTVPIESGGTGATTAAEARNELGITLENLGDIVIADTPPKTVENGKWYLIKAEV